MFVSVSYVSVWSIWMALTVQSDSNFRNHSAYLTKPFNIFAPHRVTSTAAFKLERKLEIDEITIETFVVQKRSRTHHVDSKCYPSFNLNTSILLSKYLGVQKWVSHYWYPRLFLHENINICIDIIIWIILKSSKEVDTVSKIFEQGPKGAFEIIDLWDCFGTHSPISGANEKKKKKTYRYLHSRFVIRC